MERALDRNALDLAMKTLAIRLEENQSEPVEIVVCGGSALILTGMIPRTTRDVDVVALIKAGHLTTPVPLPPELVQAGREVAEDLGLDDGSITVRVVAKAVSSRWDYLSVLPSGSHQWHMVND